MKHTCNRACSLSWASLSKNRGHLICWRWTHSPASVQHVCSTGCAWLAPRGRSGLWWTGEFPYPSSGLYFTFSPGGHTHGLIIRPKVTDLWDRQATSNINRPRTKHLPNFTPMRVSCMHPSVLMLREQGAHGDWVSHIKCSWSYWLTHFPIRFGNQEEGSRTRSQKPTTEKLWSQERDSQESQLWKDKMILAL